MKVINLINEAQANGLIGAIENGFSSLGRRTSFTVKPIQVASGPRQGDWVLIWPNEIEDIQITPDKTLIEFINKPAGGGVFLGIDFDDTDDIPEDELLLVRPL